MSDTFQFTELKMHTPHDNLAAALGILQNAMLATDHGWNTDIALGPIQFHRSQPLQAALSLLLPLIDAVDGKRWGE